MAELFTGLVTFVNTKRYSCDVKVDDVSIIHDAFVMNAAGGPQQIEVSWLSNLLGAEVVVARFGNRHVVLGTVPNPTDRNITVSDLIAMDGEYTPAGDAAAENISFPDGQFNLEDPTGQPVSFYKNGYTNFLPGDKVIAADGGASLGVYRGGLAVLKGSPLAQIVMGGSDNFMDIVARELRIFTDYGSLGFTHGSSGKTSFNIMGGAAYRESSPVGIRNDKGELIDPAKFDSSKDNAAQEVAKDSNGKALTAPAADASYLGGTPTAYIHCGDVDGNDSTRIGLRVRDLDGKNYSAIGLEESGRAVIASSEDIRMASAKDMNISVRGKLEEKFEGTSDTQVVGRRTQTVVGDEKTHTGGDFAQVVAGASTHVIGKDEVRRIEGQLTDHIVGHTGVVIDDSADVNVDSEVNVSAGAKIYLESGGTITIKDNTIVIKGTAGVTVDGGGGGVTVKGGPVSVKCTSFSVSR